MITWKRAAVAIPAVGVSLLPKLACPMCWPAYAGALSALGLSFLISRTYLFWFTAIFFDAHCISHIPCVATTRLRSGRIGSCCDCDASHRKISARLGGGDLHRARPSGWSIRLEQLATVG